MRSTGTTGSRFRARKLNTKTPLPILRESDLDNSADNDALGRDPAESIGSLPKVESGVESKEEREHHLQQVINASQAAAVGGNLAQISIPTPDAVVSGAIKYEKLYSRLFVQPATYIRSSATVEDSTGVSYCMNDDDDEWLKNFNAKHKHQCSEDEFEQLMSAFEETSALRQPFAAVDNTPVLEIVEMESAFDETVSDAARRFARDVYGYWKDQRSKNGNRSLMPKLKTLKMESGHEADDNDPYVCFRRREVRQARKTRGRDAQVVEKLKKLRRELEDARQIVYLVKDREMARKQDLLLSRKIFEQRSGVREMKRKLNIQDDDDDLITQRPRKQPPKVEHSLAQPRPSGQQQRSRLDSAVSNETEIVFLRSLLDKQEREVSRQIHKKIDQHEEWNARYYDFTEDILRGTLAADEVFIRPETRDEDTIRFAAIRQEETQLPTPPPSNPATSDDEADQPSGLPGKDAFRFREEQPLQSNAFRSQAHVRLRSGRCGRLYLDRHNLKCPAKRAVDARVADRYKYDHDDGDEDSDIDEDGHLMRSFRLRSAYHLGELAADRRLQEKFAAQQRRTTSNSQVSAQSTGMGTRKN